ncbi:MAG: Flp family type IVb pilin [Acidimicrobiales bacterium]
MLQFNYLKTWLQARFADSERGASLVEYALLVALIAVVCIAAITLLGESASDKFDEVADEIS